MGINPSRVKLCLCSNDLCWRHSVSNYPVLLDHVKFHNAKQSHACSCVSYNTANNIILTQMHRNTLHCSDPLAIHTTWIAAVILLLFVYIFLKCNDANLAHLVSLIHFFHHVAPAPDYADYIPQPLMRTICRWIDSNYTKCFINVNIDPCGK